MATVPREKARGLPPSIENRGLLDAAGYSKLLGEAQVALGLGDPVLGPGALDALEHGCAVVQVKYPRPRVEKWVNPRLPWRTQHDFVDAVGAPWVASVSLEEYPDAVRRALDAVSREPPRSRLPAEYSDAALLGRSRVGSGGRHLRRVFCCCVAAMAFHGRSFWARGGLVPARVGTSTPWL